jgi:uncharacterized peroxidase-related enzyme
MSLIDPLPAGSVPELEDILQLFRTVNGYEPNSLLTMQRRPAIVRALVDLHKAIIATESRVTAELKLLIAHVTSAAAGCRYCQAHTAYTAEKLGASNDRIDKIWEFRTSPLFTEAERAALELGMAAGVTPSAVTQELVDEAKRHWDDGELVEIAAIISLFGFMNRWNDTVGTPLEDAPKSFGGRRLTAHGWTPGRH